ncbi:MAG: hypothetical protein ACK4YP_07155, partial [Myxococcota bacterium]
GFVFFLFSFCSPPPPPPPTPPLVALVLLTGCQTIDLSQEWELDRLRLLAIRAEPAEPRPGDTVTFTSLSHVPAGEDWTAVWFGCVLGGDAGCSFDPAVLEGLEDFETMTPEEQAEAFAALQEAGFLGIEPGMTPTWSVPPDALAGLSETDALEGVSATIQVTLATEADTELVLKRVPVSLAATPNTNPNVATFTFDGAELAPGDVVDADAGGTYDLEASVTALETYTYVTTDGVTEERTEELEWRWYATGGTLGGTFSFGDASEDAGDNAVTNTWTAPSEPGDHTLHAVVLDGRGGMGWWTVYVRVE